MNDIITFYKPSDKLVVKSKDCYLYDTEGKEYIDFESGVWCSNIGHCNDRLTALIEKQIKTSVHHGYRFRNHHSEQLSKKLQQLIGFPNGSSVFLSSGSEAVNLAIALSQHLTRRKKILKIENSYLSAYGLGQISAENKHIVNIKFNDISAIKSIDFKSVAALVLETGGASVEMVQFPAMEFVKQLVELSKDNHCLIIAEEVTTGMGRLGKWFGFQHYNFMPDMVVTGKGLGNGYPVSAVTISSSVADRFEQNPFRYAQSHQNDPLGAAIGIEVIKIIEENNLVEKANATGIYFKNQLDRIKKKYPAKIKDIRARGLMLALEFQGDFNGEHVSNLLFEDGFVIGFKLNTLRFLPPLTIKPTDIDKMIHELEKILTI